MKNLDFGYSMGSDILFQEKEKHGLTIRGRIIGKYYSVKLDAVYASSFFLPLYLFKPISVCALSVSCWNMSLEEEISRDSWAVFWENKSFLSGFSTHNSHPCSSAESLHCLQKWNRDSLSYALSPRYAINQVEHCIPTVSCLVCISQCHQQPCTAVCCTMIKRWNLYTLNFWCFESF